MLHQQIDFTGSGAIAASLLASARASLDNDLGMARECLKQLAALPEFQHVPVATNDDTKAISNEPVRGGLAAWQIRRIAAYVDANLGDTIAISDLASEVRLSSGHFCRAFKVSMAETPHTYVTRRRIEHAQLLMLTTSETLSQVAYACGLTDQAHLTRLFRRFVNQTPLSWRRTWRQAA